MASGAEQRRETRESLFEGEFPGHLLHNDNESEPISVRPLDVSPRGLGFFSKIILKPGDFFWLVIGDHKFRVELAYCNQHLGIDDLFRCGLFLREEEGNLTNICRDLGILK